MLTFLFLISAQAANPNVYRDALEPHWFAEGTRFWYRNDNPSNTREFILVDAEEGIRTPAFDHAKVAQLIGEDLEPSRLPIESLEFNEDGSALKLLGNGRAWLLDVETQVLTEIESCYATEPGLMPREQIWRSKGGGGESGILFENRLDQEVSLFWVDTGGKRQPYGTLQPGQQRDQHTFEHHAWLVLDIDGNPVAAFVATSRRQLAVIDESTPVPQPQHEQQTEPQPTSVKSPDGNWEAFVRNHKLWVRHTEDGAETQLSQHGDAANSFHRDAIRARAMGMNYDKQDYPESLPEVVWSPDSKKLVAIKTTVVPEPCVFMVESSPTDQIQPKLHSYPYIKPGDDIPVEQPHLFDVEAGVELTMDASFYPNPWNLGRFTWSGDSSFLSFLYNQRGHQLMRVITIHLDSGDAPACATLAVVEESSDTFINYSSKTFLQILDDTDELIWMSERDGWNHLYLINTRTGVVKHQTTRGEWVVRAVERVDEASRQIWFRACGIHPGQDPTYIHECRVDFDGSNLVVLTEGDGTHSIEWSPDGRWFIDKWSRVDQPPVHELRQATDGALVCHLEEADASEVTGAGYGFPERFVAKGRDGSTDIHGIIHRPKDFDPSLTYPMVENIYAGPHGQHVPKPFHKHYRHQQEIADRGLIVVQVDGMGTNWRSKAFHDVAWKNIKDAGFPDRIAWMKAVAATRPWMDISRVGIYGGSAGGQNAMRAVLDHAYFYRAAAADCGCHDNRMDKIWWNEAWMGWPVDESYAQSSNVVDAHKLSGKLLLTVGELDRNVDPASTYQVVHALKEAGKDFEFMIMTGQGHGAGESDYGRKLRLDFLVKHLLPPSR